MIIERGDFWEFKARCAELDLEIAQLRLKLKAAVDLKNGLVTKFAVQCGLDPMKALTLEDRDCSVTQPGTPSTSPGDGADG